MATFTKLYVLNRAAPYTPATIRGTYDTTTGSVTKALDPAKAPDGGSFTTVSVSEAVSTNPYRFLLFRGVSGPLAAQTITGNVDMVIGLRESSANADFNVHLHIYATQGDSDTPRGTLLSDYEEAAGVNELPTTATGWTLTSAQALSSLTISDGDRLVVEIGITARNGVTTSYSATLNYGCILSGTGAAAPDLAAGETTVTVKAGFISFSNAITQGTLQTRATQAGLELAGTFTDDGARATQAGLEVAWTVPVPSRVTQAGLEVAYTPLTCPTVSAGPSVCGTEDVLTWVEQTRTKTDNTTEQRNISDVTLNDAADYYGGQKEGRVLEFGEVTRTLSDSHGQWQASTVRWTLAEVDNWIRGLYGSAADYAVSNTLVVMRMIRYSQWVLKAVARLLFIGHLLKSTPNEDMSIEQESGDQLARDLEATVGEEVQCPRRLFAQLYTPGIPTTLVDVPEPIIYGKLTDELSSETPPSLYSDPLYGWGMDGTYPNFGWAPMPGPAPPTGVTITEVAGGNINLGDYPSNYIYINIVGYDADGVYGDPSSYAQQQPLYVDSMTLTGNSKKVQVDWTIPAGSTATTWRVAMGLSYFGVRYVQAISVDGAVNTCTFDNTPDYTEWTLNDYTQLATGATGCWIAFKYYWAAAKMSDGSWTALSASTNRGFGEQAFYPRTVRCECDPASVPASATHIGWWAYYAGGGPGISEPVGFSEVTVDHIDGAGYIYVDDDFLGTGWSQQEAPAETGIVPLNAYYGGKEVIPVYGIEIHRWFIASHACAQVNLYLDGVKMDEGVYNVTWWAPNHAGWDTVFSGLKYRDFNGRRYTVVYGNGPDAEAVANGTKTLTANVWGVESSAAGTGTVYTDAFDQYLHWMKNFGPLGDYQSGAWLEAPTWDPIAAHCKISRDSWVAARDAAVAAFPGGYVGAGIIKDRSSMRDWLARWNLSCDVRLGQNAAGQWIIVRHDPNTTTLAATYTEIKNVRAGSVKFEPLHEEHWNKHPYQYALNPQDNTWQTGTVTDEASIDDYGETRTAPTISLYFIRALSVALDIMGRRLSRHAALPWRVTWETIDLCGTNSDLGDVVGLTGSWGLGTSGWTAFPLAVEKHTVLPTSQYTRLTARPNVPPGSRYLIAIPTGALSFAIIAPIQNPISMPVGRISVTGTTPTI